MNFGLLGQALLSGATNYMNGQRDRKNQETADAWKMFYANQEQEDRKRRLKREDLADTQAQHNYDRQVNILEPRQDESYRYGLDTRMPVDLVQQGFDVTRGENALNLRRIENAGKTMGELYPALIKPDSPFFSVRLDDLQNAQAAQGIGEHAEDRAFLTNVERPARQADIAFTQNVERPFRQNVEMPAEKAQLEVQTKQLPTDSEITQQHFLNMQNQALQARGLSELTAPFGSTFTGQVQMMASQMMNPVGPDGIPLKGPDGRTFRKAGLTDAEIGQLRGWILAEAKRRQDSGQVVTGQDVATALASLDKLPRMGYAPVRGADGSYSLQPTTPDQIPGMTALFGQQVDRYDTSANTRYSVDATNDRAAMKGLGGSSSGVLPFQIPGLGTVPLTPGQALSNGYLPKGPFSGNAGKPRTQDQRSKDRAEISKRVFDSSGKVKDDATDYDMFRYDQLSAALAGKPIPTERQWRNGQGRLTFKGGTSAQPGKVKSSGQVVLENGGSAFRGIEPITIGKGENIPAYYQTIANLKQQGENYGQILPYIAKENKNLTETQLYDSLRHVGGNLDPNVQHWIDSYDGDWNPWSDSAKPKEDALRAYAHGAYLMAHGKTLDFNGVNYGLDLSRYVEATILAKHKFRGEPK